MSRLGDERKCLVIRTEPDAYNIIGKLKSLIINFCIKCTRYKVDKTHTQTLKVLYVTVVIKYFFIVRMFMYLWVWF